MRALVLFGIAAGIICGAGTLTTSANAATAAYLSRTGTGSACTQSAPCNNVDIAKGVAGSGGEVICLEKGNYGGQGMIINFTLTISCGDGLWEAPGAQITIDTSSGRDVIIEGLVSDGLLDSGTILNFIGSGSLHLRRVRIGNAPNSPGTPAHALSFAPNGFAELFVTDSDFYRMGTSAISAGINIRPTSGVTAQVTIERSQFQNNRFGIVADGNGGGIIRGVVRDSVIAGNVNNGITVSTTSSNVVFSVDSCTISGNNFGLVAAGSSAGMLVGRSVISANNTGLSTSSGGVLLSYGNNSVNGNNAGEAFTGAVSQK